MRWILCAFAAATALTSNAALAQDAKTLLVHSSNGVRAVLLETQPDIELAIGARLTFEFSTSRDLTSRIIDGEEFDVAVLTPSLISDLVSARKVGAGSQKDFARVGVGVGARAGTPARPVGTLDELRQTLLEAESVAYGETGQSRRTNEASFAVMGITDEIRAKTRLTGPAEAPVLVANGEIDIVLTLVSELLREPGVQFLGPFPPEVQGYIDFTAGVGVDTTAQESAEAFIGYLSTPAFIEALEAHGLEAIDP